jgi:Tfp pilus assembly protein PilF
MHRNFIFFILFFFGCASQEKTIVEKKADLYFNNGTSHLVKHNYTSALTNLLKAVKYAPERSDVHNNLAMAYFFKKDSISALKHLRKSLKLDPKNNDARMNLANLYMKQKRYSKAQTELNKILKDLTYSRQYKTYYNLGFIQMKLKNKSRAIEYFKEAIKDNENACLAHFQLAMMEYKVNKYPEALELFKTASKGVCYQTVAPVYYQGEAYIKMNKFELAKLKFMEIIDKFPKSRYAVKAKKSLKQVTVQTIRSNDQYFNELEMTKNSYYKKHAQEENQYQSPSFKK